MKKFLPIFIISAVFLSCSSCFATEKTYVLFIAPSKFTTDEFLEIATKNLSSDYIVSKKLQGYWSQYCWNMNLEENDQRIGKEILSDFISRTNLDKIVFVVFKEANAEIVDNGGVFIFGVYTKSYINSTHLRSRVVIMNHEGETLKLFEEESENISPYNERRANRGAFRILCKNISKTLNLK
ncbi:MAG: hypothetical protein IKT98_04800 [Selenomonadaceae bacterium]|nr:hypothetical protein [Selenomonadaceae bacterium]